MENDILHGEIPYGINLPRTHQAMSSSAFEVVAMSSPIPWGVDIVNEMDRQLDQKIEKRRFFQDIQNSFQWVTGIGLKMPQFFSF